MRVFLSEYESVCACVCVFAGGGGLAIFMFLAPLAEFTIYETLSTFI